MKRKAFLMTLVLLIGMAAVACGAGEEVAVSPTPTPPRTTWGACAPPPVSEREPTS